MKGTETNAAKFTKLETELVGVQSAQHEAKKNLLDLEGKMERLFTQVFAKLDERSKTPWNLIIASIAVIVTIGGTLIGAALTVTLAIAAAGNAYFSATIDNVKIRNEVSDQRQVSNAEWIATAREKMARLEERMSQSDKERNIAPPR